MAIDYNLFFKSNNLQSYLDFFHHEDVTENSLLLEGQRVTWEVARKRIFGESPVGKLPHGWKYNDRGLVEKNQAKWVLLEPDWDNKVDPRPGKFFHELVSQKKGFLGVSRHCWTRLIDDQGRVISVGMCGKVHWWLPLRSQKGSLFSPDPGEFDRGEKIVTRTEITQEEYERLKREIEEDQENQDLYFNMITRNCSSYASEKMKSIGIRIDNSEYPSQAFSRKIMELFKIQLPGWLIQVFHFIGNVFRVLLSPLYNLGILILGGAYEEKSVVELERVHGEKWRSTHRKPFKNLFSLFDGSNFRFATGWKVTVWQEAIANIRKNSENQYEKPKDLIPTPTGFKVAE